MKEGYKFVGVACSECGSVFTSGKRGGFSPSGHRIRMRACNDCGHTFTTVEVAADFVFNRVDTASQERARKRRAKYPRKYSSPLRLARASNDDLLVSVSVKPGKPNPWCNKLLHRMVNQNIKITSKGHRRCRACIREAGRERSRIERMVNGDKIRRQQREWYARGGQALKDKRAQQRALRKLVRKVTDDSTRNSV